MKQQRFDEAQIIGILKQQELGVTVAQVCWEHDTENVLREERFVLKVTQ